MKNKILSKNCSSVTAQLINHVNGQAPPLSSLTITKKLEGEKGV